MAYKKNNLSKLIHLFLVSAMIISSGCVTTHHQPTTLSKVLFIGSVQSTVQNKEKPISLIVGSKAAGHLTCFYRNQEKNSMLVYPNKLSEDAYIGETTTIDLSEQTSFKLTKTPKGLEKLACFLTQKNINFQLPDAFKEANLVPYDIPQIKKIYDNITQQSYHYAEAIL